MNSSFISFRNIKLILISLIVIFGIIFIIIGERPRHKEPIPQQVVKAPVSPEKPYAQSKPIPQSSDTVKKSPVTTTTEVVTRQTSDSDSSTVNVDAKKIIREKYKDSGNKEIYERALENHKTNIATLSSSENNETDTAETDAGLETTSDRLDENSSKSQEASKPVPEVAGKAFFDLQEPAAQEKEADKELNKIAVLQESNPSRYSTESIADQSMIYMIDTYTASLKVLYKESDIWKDLGSPEDAEKYNSSIYGLEGVTKESAIIFNSTTAQTWKVSINGNDISWKTVHPFPDSDN